MIKIVVIAVLLVAASFFSRKNKALYRSVRERRRRVLDRLANSNEDRD